MVTKNSTVFPGRRVAWLALLAIVLLGLAMVLIPVWVIMPFKPQSQCGVELSYVLRCWSPLVTIVAFAAALMLIVWLWSGARRRWRKVALVVAILPLFAATWFAR